MRGERLCQVDRHYCTVPSARTFYTVQTLRALNMSTCSIARFARSETGSHVSHASVCTVFLLALVPYCPDPSRAQCSIQFHRSLRSLFHWISHFARFGL